MVPYLRFNVMPNPQAWNSGDVFTGAVNRCLGQPANERCNQHPYFGGQLSRLSDGRLEVLIVSAVLLLLHLPVPVLLLWRRLVDL